MIILASQSPRRRDLLEREGVDFRVETRPVDEVSDAALRPEELCALNAAAKAGAVAADFPNDIVVGADTLVFIDGRPLGKPADTAEARSMLRTLAGRTHCVCTAVAVFMPGGERRDFSVKSRVTFRPMSDTDIGRYLAEVHVLDKAGAYAMQEKSELIVERVEGDVDNVIGLPVKTLLQVLRQGERHGGKPPDGNNTPPEAV